MRKYLRALVLQLRADLRPDTERGTLVRSAGATAGLKVGATLLAFAASLVYARALGPHGYGLYVYVIAWTALLTIPAGLGLPQYLIREGAKAPQSAALLRRWADLRIVLAGITAAALLACAVYLPQAAGARWLFVVAAPLPLLTNLAAVRKSLLQGYGWIVRSQWPQLILAPALMLAGMGALWLWRGELRAMDLVVGTVATALVPLLINTLQLTRATGKQNKNAPIPTRTRDALPFMWLGAMYFFLSRTDLIMLGAMRGADAAGVYAIAARASDLVPFFMAAATISIAPKIAQLFNASRIDLLQRMLTSTARRVLLISAPAAAVLIVAASPIITYAYGPSYNDGAVVLQILACAQLFLVIGGPLGTILDMVGQEKANMLVMATMVIVNVILNLILIPLFGIKGAAFATAASVVLARCALWYLVRTRLGLKPGVLPF